MNRYGRLAQQHWAKWRPNQLRQISDQEAFFTGLGLEAESQIDQLTATLEGDDHGGETYLEKLGRLRMARITAEDQIFRDLVLLPPEQGHPEAEADDTPIWPSTSDWLPVEMRPDHPNYHELDDDPGLQKMRPPTPR